jgi:ABC-type lipoprotein export system ATPase subunit
MEVECKDLEFSYDDSVLIKNLNLKIHSKEHLWIKGQSGSGKSSFLRLIGGLISPISGSIRLGDDQLDLKAENARRKIRLETIGYLHQENHLIEHWTVRQNLQLVEPRKAEFQRLLEEVNLHEKYLSKQVSELSGGEKQRISFVRLLLQRPKLALLDEPTSHLDDRNANALISLLVKRLQDSTVIVVSHDNRLAEYNLKPVDFFEINK